MAGQSTRPLRRPAAEPWPANPPDHSADLRAEVARLTGQLEGAMARLADRDSQIAQLRADAEQERADHRAELDRLAAAHAAEMARLQQVIDRLTTPWWRRWFEG